MYIYFSSSKQILSKEFPFNIVLFEIRNPFQKSGEKANKTYLVGLSGHTTTHQLFCKWMSTKYLVQQEYSRSVVQQVQELVLGQV